MSEPVASEPLRLSKRVAALRACSRSDAEMTIVGGWVRVDGVVVEQPQARVRPEQRVEIDPKARLVPLEPATLIWHKPAGVALPAESPLPEAQAMHWFSNAQRFNGDRSGLRALQVHRRQLLTLSPLDAMASGLMVFTQHPGVARKVNDRQAPLEHEWFVDVVGDSLPGSEERDAVLRSITKPLYFEGTQLAPVKVSWQSDWRLRLAIKGPIAGQVAHLCERAGLGVAAVRRQRIGRVGLDNLPPGQWRYATATERF